MKRCINCGAEKPLDDFYRHPRMADGHLGACKECVKARVNQYRQDNLERIQEYDRRRGLLPHRKEDVKARRHLYPKDARRFRAENPEKYKAHTIVNNALKRGIVTVQPCERCGYGIGVQAHHEDYAKPLDVTWLCSRCHGERHREINAERRALQKGTAR